MIKRFFSVLQKEVNSLHEAAYLLALFALFSKILALVRDRVLAHFFGAGASLDVYYAAFRIPDLIFVGVASMISLFVLIPFLVEHLNTSKESAKQFIDTMFSVFFGIIIIVSAVAFLLTPKLLDLFFPALRQGPLAGELVVLTRVLLLSPIFLGFSNLFASVTQVYKRFYIYALSPILYNIGIIVGVLFLYPLVGLVGLVLGVALGAFLHFVVQLPTVSRVGLMPGLVRRIDVRAVYEVIKISLPRTVALSVHQLVLLIMVSLASAMAIGSVSVFNFALNLQDVPLSIIGVSYSVAAFPTLAVLFSNGDRNRFLEQILSAVRHIIFWSFPALVLFIVLRAQIVRTILGSGAFDWTDTRLTAAALAAFIVSLVAHALMLLFVRGYYAAGQTKRPVVINLFSSLIILVTIFIGLWVFRTQPMFAYFIEALFRIEGLPGTEIVMLPLAYSFGLIVNVLLLWYFFQRDFGRFPGIVIKTLLHSFSAAVLSGTGAYVFLNIFDNIFDINTLSGIFMQGLLSGLIGIVVGIAVLFVLRNQELVVIRESLRNKFWKATPVAPEPEEL